MGFFSNIKQQHGTTSVELLKTLANNYIKQASLRNRRIFLLRCRQKGLLPNHITQGTLNINSMLHHTRGNTGQRILNFNHRLRKNILNLEIKVTFCDLDNVEKTIKEITKRLYNCLPHNIVYDFIQRQKVKSNKTFLKIKRTNIKKINALIQYNLKSIKTQPKWFKNLTDVDIPQDIIDLISLGPKFCLCPTTNDISIPSLLADLERIIYNFDNEQKDTFRAQYTNIITNHIHKHHDDRPFLSDIFKKSKLFFKNHPELYILKSDKGNVTVAMYKDEYNAKSQELLDDDKYYLKLNRNPTYTFQLKANAIVNKLKDRGFIDNDTAKNIMAYNTIAPRFYTLPKIHKPTLSVRPIVSSINCPNGQLAKYITDILTRAYNVDNDYYVRDSFSFSTFINNFQIPPDYVIVSFDVVSLFTNLSMEVVLKSLRNNWNSISPCCPFDFETLERVIEFIFDSNFTIFNGTYYKQIFGTPMGSKISPILVNFVLDDLVKDCLHYMPHHIPFVKRYVDDLLLAVPKDQIGMTLEFFNTYDRHIQFTVEEETNRAVPFLDMLVMRTENNILKQNGIESHIVQIVSSATIHITQ
ncbi:uncharacterized protein LOC115888393 [Sitophilus oryzae]|uniref:Uncharacterized protein LOC115888393 n=1 Tax=Sitophilus oryzae TaxID=7048 RepID=A0A6J2YLE5_SITOR|nr:uncharacterized protein LOC115888393 [Sitophilus oryzae]